MKQALFIVDLQHDFVHGTLAVPQASEIIPVINTLIPRYHLRFASKDWHGTNNLAFAEVHKDKKPFVDTVQLPNGKTQQLWPRHCVATTRGAEYATGLADPQPVFTLLKGVNDKLGESYGAFGPKEQIRVSFADRLQLKSEGLADELANFQITGLDICGLATDYCMGQTALQAIEHGYKVRVLNFACRGVAPESTREMLMRIQAAGGTIIESPNQL